MHSWQSQINKTFEARGLWPHNRKDAEFFPPNNDGVLCDFEDMLAS